MSQTKAKPAVADHPTYLEMIIEAISALKERKGASRQAILKYIQAHYTQLDMEKKNSLFKNAFKKGVEAGKLTPVKGSFKVAKAAVVPKKKVVKKPAVKKPAKKKPAAKKPVAKKAAAKKPSAKKPAAKKAAAKKAAAKKPAAKKSPAKKAAPSKKAPAKKTPAKKTPAKKAKKAADK